MADALLTEQGRSSWGSGEAGTEPWNAGDLPLLEETGLHAQPQQGKRDKLEIQLISCACRYLTTLLSLPSSSRVQLHPFGRCAQLYLSLVSLISQIALPVAIDDLHSPGMSAQDPSPIFSQLLSDYQLLH